MKPAAGYRPLAYSSPEAVQTTGTVASCHAGGPSMVPPRGIDLALSSALSGPDPSNAIIIVLDGIQTPEGQRGPLMSRFDSAFVDRQLAGNPSI